MRRHGRQAQARRLFVERAVVLAMYAAKCKRIGASSAFLSEFSRRTAAATR